MEKINILFWTLIILAIILLAWQIFGKSPSVESIIGILITSELALWKLAYKHGRQLTSVRKDTKFIKDDVGFIKDEIKSIKNELATKKDINSIKESINFIKNKIRKKIL